MKNSLKYTHDELVNVLCSRPFNGYSFDSRLVTPGSLFFALRGAQLDGHDFLDDVAHRGAKAAVVNVDYCGDSHGMTLYYSENPKKILQSMAKYRLEQLGAPIVAVTGSLGKTTTKEFLKVLLEKKFRLFSSPGNQNSQVGMPLAVLNQLKGDEQLVVLEMGMSLPGEIKQLVEIAPPAVALLTHVDLVHIANFNSLQAIALEKADIFSHSSTKMGFIPKEVPCFEEIAAKGICPKASFSLSSHEGDYLISHPMVNLLGKHNYHNLLGALNVARFLGMSEQELEGRFPLLSLPQRRLEQCVKGGITFINDSHNAAALSVKAALEVLPSPERGGRKFAVLGEMLELGDFSDQCHRDVGEHALAFVDAVYLLGEGCRSIQQCWHAAGRPAFLYTDQDPLVADLKRALQPGDVVLLKGSWAKKMWEVMEKL